MRLKNSARAELLREENAVHLEALLDAALANSFPASDPIAVRIDEAAALFDDELGA